MKRRELATAVGAAAVLMAMIGGFVWVRLGVADRVMPLAEEQGGGRRPPQRGEIGRIGMEAEFARMQRNELRFLADLAHQHQMRGDVGTALALALEALPGGADDADRVCVAEAELQLVEGAWRSLRERHILVGHDYAVNGAAFSPDGKLLVTASAADRIRPIYPIAAREAAYDPSCRPAPTTKVSTCSAGILSTLRPYPADQVAAGSSRESRGPRSTRHTARVDRLGGLAAREGVYIGGGQRGAADSPVAAFDLLDHAPCDIAHVFAVDRDHRLGQFADDLALLFPAEHVLDDANLNEWHWLSPRCQA
jgi:hypothetical protein